LRPSLYAGLTPPSRKRQLVTRLSRRVALCDEITRLLQSVGLAFLDANVRQNAFANLWLQSNNVEIASQGIAEWSRK
jgi:hypothetical protein